MSRAAQVVCALTAEGQVDSRGDFTLDMVKAREKLRRFQLLSSRLYPLELIGAAVAGGAEKIDIRVSMLETSYVFHGMRPYTRRELAQLYSHLFLAQDEPGKDRLRQLAIGLNACLALNPRHVQIRSDGPGGAVLLRLTAAGEALTTAESDGTPRVTITVVEEPHPELVRRVLPGFADEEIRYVRGRCKHAPIPICIDGKSINQPPRLEPCVLQVSGEQGSTHASLGVVSSLPVGLRAFLRERDHYGQLIWYTGRPPGTPLDDPQVAFMINGVIVCSRPIRIGGAIPIKVLVNAPGLMKNASQSDVVENGRYLAVLQELQAMLPQLMEKLHLTEQEVRHALQDPREWPRERPDLFKRYLTSELDLIGRYLEEWEKNGNQAASEELAQEVARATVSVAPDPDRPRFDEEKWLAWEAVEGSWGKGWLALPRWSDGVVPSVRVAVTRQRVPMASLPPFVLPVAGDLEVTSGMPQTPKPQEDPTWRRVLAELTETVEDMVAWLVDSFVTLPASRQAEARRYLLGFIGEGPITVGVGMGSANLRTRIQHLPMFETTDAQTISLSGMAAQQKTYGKILYVVGEMAGRLLSADRKVLRLREVEVPLLRRWFDLLEASRWLQEDEKARELLRLRGHLGTPLATSTMLASTELRVQGLRVVLGLPRPYTDRAWLQCFKRTVFVTEQRPEGLPVHATVEGDDLATDEAWMEVTLPSTVRTAVHDQTEALYRSLVPALRRLEPSHPDYETCCRYVWRYIVERRLQFLHPASLQGTPDAEFLSLPVVPIQMGRRLTLHDLVQHPHVSYSLGGVVTSAEPVVMAEGRDWLVSALQELFGEAAVLPWNEATPTARGDVDSERGDLIGDLLVPILASYPGRLRLATSRVPGKEAMVGIKDRVVVCSAHPAIAEVLQEHRADPAVLQHLSIAVASKAARQADSPDAELRFLAGLLKKVSAGNRPPAR
ncbi:MAG: hypothetical protein ACYCW6_02710 [Candidatus Xenobia bacterium]